MGGCYIWGLVRGAIRDNHQFPTMGRVVQCQAVLNFFSKDACFIISWNDDRQRR